MKTKSILAASVAALTAHFAVAAGSNVSLKWRYQDAEQMQMHRGERVLEVNVNQNGFTDPRIEKTIFVTQLATTLKDSLKNFHEACKIEPIPGPKPIPMPTPIRPLPQPAPTPAKPGVIPPIHPFPCPPPPPIPADCEKKRMEVADGLLASVDELTQQADSNEFISSDLLVYEVLDLGRKLAKNMKEEKVPVFHPYCRGMEGVKTFAAVAGGLNITGGGAQDFGFFRKLVEDGRVPHQDSLAIEGFLSEFNLSLSRDSYTACDALVCVNPAVKIDRELNKMHVQIAMDSNVTKATFERKPLNLSIVLDISGSMSATDNTEKSRLEWAKQALIRTINELDANDMLSIVLFDTKSEILLPAQPVRDRSEIIALVNALKTKGSTNLDAGLRDGYKLVSENAFNLEGYENRIILISDAGLNTGVTDEAAILKTITNYANEGIGLTAIGLGLNFNKNFIHTITQSRGGNYIFVHSGKDMFKYFDSFNFLVTPVAYSFKVALDLNNIDAKLVNAYGVPRNEEEPVNDLIDIQTLFFSEAGGAILLEYELK